MIDISSNEGNKKSKNIWLIRLGLIFMLSFSFISISLICDGTIKKPEKVEFIYKPSNQYKTTKWSGGLTREITIYPEDADYAKRDFIFRVSSATVDLEKSDFTKLPDYYRILMVLSNQLDLTHNGGENIHLYTFGQDYFDGADDTTSVGKVTDFNLMMRKDKCDGKVNHKSIKGKVELNLEKEYQRIVILSVDGDLEIEGENNKKFNLKAFDSLIIKKEDKTKITISSKEKVNIVITKIKI